MASAHAADLKNRQGDLVNRLKLRITRGTIWITGIINLLTTSSCPNALFSVIGRSTSKFFKLQICEEAKQELSLG